MRRDAFAAAVCRVWLAESLMNVAVYLGDARAQALPLVGGHTHDWHWLLAHAGLLAHCETLARGLHLAASAVLMAAWLAAFRASDARVDATGPARSKEVPSPPSNARRLPH